MTEQEKREKVIKACKALIREYNQPPYGREVDGTVETLEDCIALLTEQEPRVMTSGEVKAWVEGERLNRTPIWLEVEQENSFACWIVSDDYFGLPRCYLSTENYAKTWRCWTSRPTDAQRRAEPWA